MAARVLGGVAQVAIGGGIVLAGLDTAIYNVDGGHRAVIYDRVRGILPDVIGEGTHFRIPFVQDPSIIDIRSTPKVIPGTTGTKDLQVVNISLRVLYRPEADALPNILKNTGKDYAERILPSLGNEVLKNVVAQYNAEQLLTEREKVSKQIREDLTTRASDFNMILDDVAITHLSYGKDFTNSVEAKVVAQQEAERSKFLVQKAEQEKLATVIRAEGEAASARLISDSLKQFGNG
jgi:prohibitin 1